MGWSYSVFSVRLTHYYTMMYNECIRGYISLIRRYSTPKNSLERPL